MPINLIITCMIITYNHKKWCSSFNRISCIPKNKNIHSSSILRMIVQLIKHTINMHFKKISSYYKLHPKEEKNIGVVENIYNGIKKINTKYFAILEGDDYWCDDSKLDVQINIMNSDHKISICGFYRKI